MKRIWCIIMFAFLSMVCIHAQTVFEVTSKNHCTYNASTVGFDCSTVLETSTVVLDEANAVVNFTTLSQQIPFTILSKEFNSTNN